MSEPCKNALRLAKYLKAQGESGRSFGDKIRCSNAMMHFGLTGQCRPSAKYRALIELATHGHVKAEGWMTDEEMAQFKAVSNDCA